MRYLCAALIDALAGAGEVAWAYEDVIVSDGGMLVGTVTLEGAVPKPKGYNLITLPVQIYCGRISDGQGWRLLQPFNVGQAGQFRDVVVYLENIEKGKPSLTCMLRELKPGIANSFPLQPWCVRNRTWSS